MSWPTVVRELLGELTGKPGRFALMLDGPHAQSVMARIGQHMGEEVERVGKILTQDFTAPAPSSVSALIGGARLLVDCEILFAPQLKLNPLQLFRTLARRVPRIILWPGQRDNRRMTFSQPGREDYFEDQLADAVVLRAIETSFPDEVPYQLERIVPPARWPTSSSPGAACPPTSQARARSVEREHYEH